MAKRTFERITEIVTATPEITEMDILIGEADEIEHEIAELRSEVEEAECQWFKWWLNDLLRKAEMRAELNSFDINMLINKCPL